MPEQLHSALHLVIRVAATVWIAVELNVLASRYVDTKWVTFYETCIVDTSMGCHAVPLLIDHNSALVLLFIVTEDADLMT